MKTDHKKTGVAIWATVALVVVLVGYPLSVGPYWWLCHQVPIPNSVVSALDAFYDPVYNASWGGPEWFQVAMRRYLDWWTRGQPPLPGGV